MTTFALIGVGKWGKNYLNTIKSLPNTSLKYLFVNSASSQKQFSSEYITSTDYHKLENLKNEVDGVIIATPASTHNEIAKYLINQGFNLLIEKPFAINSKQAQQLNNLKQEKKVKILIGNIYLYNPAIIKIKKLLENIGQVKEIIFSGLQSPIRNDIPILWDWGPHFVSISQYLLNQNPLVINAKGSNSKLQVNLNYPSTQVIMNMSWENTTKERTILIKGKKGEIKFNDISDKKISLTLNNQTTYPLFPKTPPLLNELQSFLELINSDRDNSLDQDINNIKILEFIQKSLNANQQLNFSSD